MSKEQVLFVTGFNDDGIARDIHGVDLARYIVFDAIYGKYHLTITRGYDFFSKSKIVLIDFSVILE